MKAAVLHQPLAPLTVEDIDIVEPIDREILVKPVYCGAYHRYLNRVD
jgi:Zn-dependent alcohol dehydrogenase